MFVYRFFFCNFIRRRFFLPLSNTFLLITFRKIKTVVGFRFFELNLVQVTKRNGRKGRPRWIVPIIIVTCVYQTKSSRSCWNFVLKILECWLSKVKSMRVLAYVRVYLVAYYVHYIWITIMLSFISGSCLYLSRSHSDVNVYDCRNFEYGCPSSHYLSSENYKC